MSCAFPLPAPLHDRITVVRVDASSTRSCRQLADDIASVLAAHRAGGSGNGSNGGSAGGAGGVGGIDGPAPTVVDADDVRAAAEEVALRDHERLLAERGAAAARRRELAARRTELLERAEWCESTGATARALRTAAEQAAAAVEEARLAAEAAQARRERVTEQRMAAAAAVEEARLELEGLDSAALDESDVRREIEAATRAERQATEELERAEAEVAELEARLAELEVEAARLAAEREALEAEAGGPGTEADEAEVAAALGDFDDAASVAAHDPGAAALADAISRLDEELAQLRRTTPEPPTEAELEEAELDVAVARRKLDAARAAAVAFDGPPPGWWEELCALHAEVVDAETAVQVAGFHRVAAARRRHEEALAAERARLDELGFVSYLDALMSGGRLPHEQAEDQAAVEAAAAELSRSERRLERLRSDLVAGAPLLERLQERDRLSSVAAGVLGCDPGERVLELLAEHRAVPPVVIGRLADALRAAGVPTAGLGVAEAARRWLHARAEARDPERRAALDRREAAVEAERRTVEHALGPARSVAERAAAATEAARRSVAALEGELHARVGEDARLFERSAAATALRDQVEALEARLAAAEAEALEAWTTASEALAAAEAEHQRVERDLADLRRRATRAAADLPPEHRPAFDLLSGIVALGGALRAEADALADELGAVDAAVAASDAALAAGPRAATAEDLAEGLATALAGVPAPVPVVMAEPFAALPRRAVEPLLEVLLRASAERPLVVVCADLTVIGWAIGLPAETCSLVPTRSVELVLDAAARVAD